MKVFVTGGAGFIGSHLCKRLIDMGHEVVAYDNLLLGKVKLLEEPLKSSKMKFVKADLLDLETLKKEIRGCDLVFHMAANSDISEGAKRTDLDLQIGTIATYNVLEAMRLEGVKEIVFASTSAIYGQTQVKPTPENYGPLLPISFYGASKLSCETLITAFSHNYGFKGWIYRFANIVGPHSTHGAIHDFIGRLRGGAPELKVLGNGLQKKSYLHVSDCVEGMIFGYQNLKTEMTDYGPTDTQVNIYNLASLGVTEVRFIAQEVARQLEVELSRKIPIVYGTEDRGWRGDVPFTWLDGSRLVSKGWKPRFESNQAVSQAVSEIIRE